MSPCLELTPLQGLENILWSFATLNHTPPHKLLVKTSEFMERNLAKYNQQNLALTLWAYAKIGFEVISFHSPHTCIVLSGAQRPKTFQLAGLSKEGMHSQQEMQPVQISSTNAMYLKSHLRSSIVQ